MRSFIVLSPARFQEMLESGFRHYSRRTKIIEGKRTRGIIVEDLYAKELYNILRVKKHEIVSAIEKDLNYVKLFHKKAISPTKLCTTFIGLRMFEDSEVTEAQAKEALSVLLPIVNKGIVVKNSSCYVGPKENGFFNIYLGATAAQNDRKKIIRSGTKIWDYVIENTEAIYQGTNSGLPIKSECTIGEILGNNVYIFLSSMTVLSNLEFMQSIVREIVRLVSLSDEDKSKFMKEEAKKSYIGLCSSRSERLGVIVEDTINDLSEEVEHKKAELTDLIRRLSQEKLIKESMKKKIEIPVEKWEDEFNNLFKINNLQSIFVQDGIISVNTDVLYCKDPRSGKLHEIGRFLINIDTGNGYIEWSNKDRLVRNMQAPHIFEDGHACMGNSEEIFADLIAKFEFPLAIMMAINFVEDVNVDDQVGGFVDHWPEAKLDESGKPIPTPPPKKGQPVLIEYQGDIDYEPEPEPEPLQETNPDPHAVGVGDEVAGDDGLIDLLPQVYV